MRQPIASGCALSTHWEVEKERLKKAGFAGESRRLIARRRGGLLIHRLGLAALGRGFCGRLHSGVWLGSSLGLGRRGCGLGGGGLVARRYRLLGRFRGSLRLGTGVSGGRLCLRLGFGFLAGVLLAVILVSG